MYMYIDYQICISTTQTQFTYVAVGGRKFTQQIEWKCYSKHPRDLLFVLAPQKSPVSYILLPAL